MDMPDGRIALDTILLVEDDIGLQKQLKWSVSQFNFVSASTREKAVELLATYSPSVVLLDLGLPPDEDGVSEGLATLEEILSIAPETKVIVLTGNQDRENAVKAIDLGAYDFCQKPFDPKTVGLIVARAINLRELEIENVRLKQSRPAELRGILTADPHMRDLCRNVERVADTGATVLIAGESGTGKELVARALHEQSGRKHGNMVAINCAAIPDNLLESELFGYEKGAYTGAAKQTQGKIELANNGTLFLDEIGDLPLNLQAKLLRFLQERKIERLGGRETIPVDVRVICATHQDIQSLIAKGLFREDLYYRLSEIVLKLPALRNRPADISLLAQAFLTKFATQQDRQISGFRADAASALRAYAWPGNVRELENVIKRAVIMADGSHVSAADLGLPSSAQEASVCTLKEAREEAERAAIVTAMARAGGNIMKASGLLGVTRPTMYDLLNRYGMR